MSEPEILAGRYELRGTLGSGGMAEVRDGWDTRLDRPVAIKLLHPALRAQPDLRRRFEDEARSVAALLHPNVVGVFDSGEDDGVPFIVMERLPGDTLGDRIAQGPQPPQRVHAILDDVLAALGAAHGIGLLHRDIKPANVLVAGDGVTMKVGDFGIAKSAGASLTMTGQIIGTMAYMSPERIAGAPASVADDLYAVGVVGYEALLGRRAFPQDNPASLAHAIMSSPPPSAAVARPDVHPTLTAVIDRAIARDPGRRFTSAAQMRAALHGDRRALAAGPVPDAAPRRPGAHPAPQPLPRPATKVLDQPLPPPPGAPYVAPPAGPGRPPGARRLSRPKKIALAAGALAAVLVTAIALASEPTPQSVTPAPVATTTTTPTSMPTSTSITTTTTTTTTSPPAPVGPQDGPGKKGPGGHGGGPGKGPGKRD